MTKKLVTIGDAEIKRIRAIFDAEHRLETDEDLIELAKYVEDESDDSFTCGNIELR